MNLADGFFEKMGPLAEKALRDMKALELGAIANPDENRMVGHYWLRNATLAPTAEIREQVERDVTESMDFAGRCTPEWCGPRTGRNSRTCW